MLNKNSKGVNEQGAKSRFVNKPNGLITCYLHDYTIDSASELGSTSFVAAKLVVTPNTLI